jgi:hypothetical protein
MRNFDLGTDRDGPLHSYRSRPWKKKSVAEDDRVADANRKIEVGAHRTGHRRFGGAINLKKRAYIIYQKFEEAFGRKDSASLGSLK